MVSDAGRSKSQAEIWVRVRDLPPEEKAVLKGGPIPKGWRAYPLSVSPVMQVIFTFLQGSLGFGGLIALLELLIQGKWSRFQTYYQEGAWDVFVITLLMVGFVVVAIGLLLRFFYVGVSRLILMFKSRGANRQDRLIYGFLLTDTHALFRGVHEGDNRVLRVAREDVGEPVLASAHSHARYTTPGGLSPSRTAITFQFHYLDRYLEVDALLLSGDPLEGIRKWRQAE